MYSNHSYLFTHACFYFQSAQLEDWQSAKSIYEFTATDIDGNEVSLEKYRWEMEISHKNMKNITVDLQSRGVNAS